ncbi:TetR/AcrR family transcriptional regulator [Dietzia alimentaria]|uniref:TetR/AcrR family transcriptional regulator n=1 Tax=Dietzia alimentaria TaxID=665550 RepID=UPI00029B56AA|nr:TetR/AcrR family transcriptional regulator [Dietzia alimentaria]
MPTAPLGRRERSKDAKRARIFSAASELFGERGFEAVTTREIADRADVAAGTLFRYAATKSELLLMVYNDAAVAALELGAENAARPIGPADRVLALVEPFIAEGWRQHENSIVYQRELLFGSPTDVYRAQGLDIIARMERAIAELLLDTLRPLSEFTSAADHEIECAARSIFALVHMTIVHPMIRQRGEEHPMDPLGVLRTQVKIIVAGLSEIGHSRGDLHASRHNQRRKNDQD